MVVLEESKKAELIDRVVDLVRRQEPDDAEGKILFVRRFCEQLSLDDLEATLPEHLTRSVNALLDFARQRQPGEVKLRLYNPDTEPAAGTPVHTVVEIVQDDMPFLVDSVTAELNRRDLTVHLVSHPVLRVGRDKAGRLERFVEDDEQVRSALLESFMHLEVDQETDPAVLEEIRVGLKSVLADVEAAVEDWRPMRRRLAAILKELEASPPPVPEDRLEEVKAFLRWMDDDHFTFLGYREYELSEEKDERYLRILPGSGLGILRSVRPEAEVRDKTPLTAEMAAYAQRKEILIVTKADARATVHRPVHMDYIGIKKFDRKGEAMGERRFLGLFTSTAYNRSARTIPLLRRKVEKVLSRAGFAPTSHDGKALGHILETFPRDELFQASVDELFEISMGILRLQERQRTALFVRRDSFGRFASCLVFVPRDRFNTQVRVRIGEVLEEAFDGKVTAFYTQASDEPLARVHFIVKTTPGRSADLDLKDVEGRIAATTVTWADRLREVLVETRGEKEGLNLHRRYGDAFPTAYREVFDIQMALFDVERLEMLAETGEMDLDLYRPADAAADKLHFKIYHRGGPITLSDVLPRLENMGLRVVAEMPYEVWPAGARQPMWIRDFEVVIRDRGGVSLERVKDSFEECFTRVWRGEVEDDGFNRLILGAGLTWREVTILRAFTKYLRQAGIAFSNTYLQQTLAANTEVVRLLIRLFATLFDPAQQRGAKGQAEKIRTEIKTALEAVSNLDQDRILRRYLNLLLAIRRTNYFQKREDGQPKAYLSFKLDSVAVRELPKPRPKYEIFVYSPRTEAVHLRGGLVARGGIRWSDRREDFRNEILSLMKAQMVKNAVIVPVGAKGGFVVKRPPKGDREALREEGIACHQTMIRGLLDLTDNLKGGRVEPPPDVVRHDEDDVYLVVAADKGTATFSDIANEVAAEYDFWLGDAFASGGSMGYDHKKMGITARGAWETIKRHFRELGLDIQQEDFTAAGVGDMSGDVFGNGMLLSRHIKLVAAFNHQHIFVDPDPDPERGFAERQRLFALERSSWNDYDPDVLSPGGGIFDRQAKAIQPSREIRNRLAIHGDEVTPDDLIRAILRSPVDLLWLGGIGTFVKARTESHAETGDRSNDAVRVDARELRCRVVGEGANLGFTQLARIEFALNGGKINADFIDNSAGVDCSDHEVNIKILLGEAVAAGRLDAEERNRLLTEMTDEVAQLVLRDNYLQTQAISVALARGPGLLTQQGRLIRELERSARLDRALEFLPDDEELASRVASGRGLTRPEMAVMLAYSKIWLFEELLQSELPDDPLLDEDLALYFPLRLRERFRDEIQHHRLRREIITTHVTNSMINRVGPSFVHEMVEDTGRPVSDIARAYAIARESFGVRSTWSAIESLDNRVPAQVQLDMILETSRLIERATRWYLRHYGDEELDVRATVGEFGAGIQAMEHSLEQMLPADEWQDVERRAQAYAEQGVPQDLARRVGSQTVLGSACDIVRIAQQSAIGVEEAGRIYFKVGVRFGFDWLRQVVERLEAEGSWERAAMSALAEDLFGLQDELTRSVLTGSDGRSSDEVIGAWIDARSQLVGRVQQVLTELKAAPAPDLAMLIVASRQLRLLVEV